MDVKKSLSLIFCLSFFACAEDSSEGGSPLRQNVGACQNQEIKGQYLIQWNDGRVEKVEVKDKEELMEKWIEPNKEEITLVEPNIRLELPKENLDEAISTQNLSIHWHHDRVESQYAWDKGADGEGIMVAVIDSGVDVEHPQLRDQIAINHGEIPNNGIDDDGNGFEDDYKGYDFFHDSGNITDLNGHGTHVAGIIAASHIGENSPKGVAPKAKILALSFMDQNGGGDTSAAIAAIRYAHKRGAKIINASWGSNACSTNLRDVIEHVTSDGVLFVAAAGNQSLDLNIYQTYPTSFGFPGMISVSAISPNGFMAHYSNYGRAVVDVAAPGSTIYSTYKEGAYKTLSGTSMAAPILSGIAAQVLSLQPFLPINDLKSIIINGVEPAPLAVISRGEANTANAVNITLSR